MGAARRFLRCVPSPLRTLREIRWVRSGRTGDFSFSFSRVRGRGAAWGNAGRHGWIALILFFLLLMTVPSALSALEIAADDARLHYSGYASMSPMEEKLRTRYVRFDRMIPHSNHAQYDNPGVRLRFKTNAKSIRVRLRYTGLHGRHVPRNSIGLYYVDGVRPEEGTFAPPEDRDRSAGSSLDYLLKLPADGTMHTYEIVLPLADSVDVRGLSVNDKAVFQEPAADAARCVIYGDSVVRSLDASSIECSFPFLFGRLKNWDVVNMGMENIALTPWHAEFLKRKPQVRMIFVTPLYSAARARSGRPLEEYRAVFHAVASERKESKIQVIDGPSLVANDASFFAPDRIGLNDVGARQLAENLAEAVR